jgi:hypothetical protein
MTATRASRSQWPVWAVVGGVSAVVAGVLIWRSINARPSLDELRIEVNSVAIVARDPRGDLIWQHAFPVSDEVQVASPVRSSRSLSSDPPGVLVWTILRMRRTDQLGQNGEVMWFDPGGKLQRTFSFADRVTLGGETFEPPWVLSDVAVHESGNSRRIAVASHHFTFHPSLVTVLDDNWQRRGTFLHAGWIEHVSWLTPDRVLVAGFSQERDGGMIAIMPADALERGIPDIMIAMARSEVNLAAGAPVNRAIVERVAKRIVVRTIEFREEGAQGAADALYEFDESLTLQDASYSTRYWEAHQALEREGKLKHSRDQCPDRPGPRSVFVWKPPADWIEMPTRSGR